MPDCHIPTRLVSVCIIVQIFPSLILCLTFRAALGTWQFPESKIWHLDQFQLVTSKKKCLWKLASKKDACQGMISHAWHRSSNWYDSEFRRLNWIEVESLRVFRNNLRYTSSILPTSRLCYIECYDYFKKPRCSAALGAVAIWLSVDPGPKEIWAGSHRSLYAFCALHYISSCP